MSQVYITREDFKPLKKQNEDNENEGDYGEESSSKVKA
jgi:hypothetical protein